MQDLEDKEEKLKKLQENEKLIDEYFNNNAITEPVTSKYQ